MNDPIRETLRREASADTPAFSSDLHGQVMRRVRESRATESSAPVAPSPSIFKLLAGAATLTAGIAVVTWVLMPSPLAPVRPTKAVSLGPIDRLLTGAHPARWTFDQASPVGMAYLDQDAKSFGRFVMQRLDCIPGMPAKPAPAENTGG